MKFPSQNKSPEQQELERVLEWLENKEYLMAIQVVADPQALSAQFKMGRESAFHEIRCRLMKCAKNYKRTSYGHLLDGTPTPWN